MSHFAEIDENNKVINLVVGPYNDLAGDEGYSWLVQNLGGRWVKTSYNARIRKNYAVIGGVYDEDRDAFIGPKPYDSWVLNEETCQWEAPAPMPAEGIYYWNEDLLKWSEIIHAETENTSEITE